MRIPKYKIGDIVFVYSEQDKEVILQGMIKSAQYYVDWFYEIEAKNPTRVGDLETIYSYEVDTGDAKSKFIIPEK